MTDTPEALRARFRARKQDYALAEKRLHIARQEETIRHLAAGGRSTTLAEKRLLALRRALDAMLERRRNRLEC